MVYGDFRVRRHAVARCGTLTRALNQEEVLC